MRHRILTCRNHPELRWSCKEVAWTTNPDGTGYYNGARNIFFAGFIGSGMYSDKSGVRTLYEDPLTGRYANECECSSHDLVLAPEDKLVKR